MATAIRKAVRMQTPVGYLRWAKRSVPRSSVTGVATSERSMATLCLAWSSPK